MQTFLPDPSYTLSAAYLDRQRLGKQRVEAFMLLQLLVLPDAERQQRPWGNHPVVRLWLGYPEALWYYLRCMSLEWIARGYKDTRLEAAATLMETHHITPLITQWPTFSPALHASHRAALLYKDLAHYSRFSWTETPAIHYVW